MGLRYSACVVVAYGVVWVPCSVVVRSAELIVVMDRRVRLTYFKGDTIDISVSFLFIVLVNTSATKYPKTTLLDKV